jgi:stage III sporulation protein AF
MDSFLSSWAVSIAVAILFSSVVSMLLPESGIKKYVSVVMGVVVTIIILAPIVSLFSGKDVASELKGAFKEADSATIFEPDGEQYKDYIYDLYQVYMENDENKNE